MRSLLKCLLLLALAGAGFAGLAQTASVALYEGPDRQARLVEGAKKEATVQLYATTPIEYLRPIIAGFEKKYPGVKVNLWRSRSENVLQRITAENKSAPAFDVVECITTPMEAMRKEGILQRVNAPVHAELQPWAVPPHREWAATQLYLFVQAYNTEKVRREELPRTYTDLLDPKWKGRLAMEASDHEWFSEVIKQLGGEDKGLKFWRDLVAGNGVQLRTGHSLLNNLVGSGEVALALTVYNIDPDNLKKKGSPIDWFALEPAIAIPNGVGVSRKAPHPHAAVLLYEYLLGEEAQQVLARTGYVTSQKKIPASFTKPIKVLDPAVLLEEWDKSSALFERTMVKAANR